MNEPLAPIAVFVYARPAHTRRTLKALASNKGIESSDVYFFCDGQKLDASPEVLASIEETRSIVRSFDAGLTQTVLESDQNQGLRDAIIQGVEQVLAKHETVIVLEDDIETSAAFLSFMNDALNCYRSEERVMHISGYWFPVKSSDLPETFFYNAATCWGWATWRGAWKKLNLDTDHLVSEIRAEEQRVKRFTLDGKADFLRQLDMNRDGRMKTWAVLWFASIFLNDGLVLHPSHSFTRNIGFDGSGEHKMQTDLLHWDRLNSGIELKPVALEESQEAILLMKRFYKRFHDPGIKEKVKQRLQNIIPYLKS